MSEYECTLCGWNHPDPDQFKCKSCWRCPSCLTQDGHDDELHELDDGEVLAAWFYVYDADPDDAAAFWEEEATAGLVQRDLFQAADSLEAKQ